MIIATYGLMASFIAGGGPTHVSGFDINGVAPGVKILPVRVFPGEGDPGANRWLRRTDFADVLAKGIRYAADEGADVICVVPWTTGGGTAKIKAAVACAQAKNAVVVPGNERVAVRHDGVVLAGFAGLTAAGAAVLALAGRLVLRGRRRTVEDGS